MKKLVLAVLGLCLIVSGAWADVEINATNFPDENFRNYISENFDGDHDDSLSDSEIESVITIDVHNENISSLNGIEYFPYLKYLDCYDNQLTELNVTENSELIILWCNDNDLKTLDVTSNSKLQYLLCDNNYISELDVTKNPELIWLTCNYNNLTSLDVTHNVSLDALQCNYNRISKLDVTKNVLLTNLTCNYNNLTSLDVTHNVSLDFLYCGNNNLTELDLTKNPSLITLSCSENQITELDLSHNTALEELWCYANRLMELDLSNNKVLYYLGCTDNQLTQLNLSNNTLLESLSCLSNQLATLDLGNNTLLGQQTHDLNAIAVVDGQFINGLRITHVQNENVQYPYSLNFNEYMASEQIHNIQATSVKGFDESNLEIESNYSNGVAQFIELPVSVKYVYNTGFQNLIMNVTISNFEYMTESLNNHVYRIFTQTVSWNTAKTFCESLGGHLVTITNDDEWNLVKEQIIKARKKGDYDQPSVWIGGESTDDAWYWITGESFEQEVSGIVPFEMNISQDNDYYLLLNSSGDLVGIDVDFDRKSALVRLGFICEWEPVSSDFASLNPEYERFIQDPKAYIGSDDFYGAIPNPVDLSHLINNPPQDSEVATSMRTAATLPAKYDPRSSGTVPPVGNQNPYGTCWVFGSIGALEASYIAQGFGTTAPNLSELHLAWFAFKDPRPGYSYSIRKDDCILSQGGWSWKAISFLSWIGSAAETDLPYQPVIDLYSGNDSVETNNAKVENLIPKNKLPEDYTHPITLRDGYVLGVLTNENRETMKTLIKRFITEKKAGAVSVAFFWDPKGVNNDVSFYYPIERSNHIVDIVGWDDNYSRSNFGNYKPNSDGAWLIKNSWGTNRHDNGFFWMSYEQYLTEVAVLMAGQNNDYNKYGFGHDSKSSEATLTYNWSANMFKAQTNEILQEVAFTTVNNNVNYEVYVNTYETIQPPTVGPLQGNAVAKGTLPYFGYHTVTLGTPVEIGANQYFAVIVKLSSNSSYKYASSAVDEGGVRAAKVTTAGKSYFANKTSGNLVSADWKEATTITDSSGRYCNACIKAFTVTGDGGLRILTSSLPVGTVGQEYSCTLSASGTGTMIWSATGLPDELKIDGNHITGTPQKVGNYSVEITVTNDEFTVSKTLQLVINDENTPTNDEAPKIITTSLPSGTVGQFYSEKIRVTGSGDITLNINGVPDNFSLGFENDFVLYGTP